MLVDTHCHLDFESFEVDLVEVVGRAREAGILRIVVQALGLDNCTTVVDIADRFDGVIAAVGVHPNYSADWRDEWIDDLRQLTSGEQIVAIGEIGLDYYRDHTPRDIQMRSLEAQLDLAAEVDLPVILHNRDSDSDLLAALKSSRNSSRNNPGVLHSFSTSWATATAALDLGYYLGFSGPVPFKKADELREIVSKVPSDRILVETDAPFLAPQSYRGKRNEPAYVSIIAEKIASVRGVKLEKFARQSTENAIRLFGNRLV